MGEQPIGRRSQRPKRSSTLPIYSLRSTTYAYKPTTIRSRSWQPGPSAAARTSQLPAHRQHAPARQHRQVAIFLPSAGYQPTTGETTVVAVGRGQLRAEHSDYTESVDFALPSTGTTQTASAWLSCPIAMSAMSRWGHSSAAQIDSLSERPPGYASRQGQRPSAISARDAMPHHQGIIGGRSAEGIWLIGGVGM